MNYRPNKAPGSGFYRCVDPDSIHFLMYSSDEIRKLSVVKITTTQTFDALGHPSPGGLHDPAMGPMRERNDFCATCSGTLFTCPGHFGHIDLPLTIVNPLFFKTIYMLFRMSCIRCHRIQINETDKFVLNLQLNLLDAGFVTAALDLENVAEAEDSKKKGIDKNELIRKYKKLLKHKDPVTIVFHNKNTGVLRTRFVTNFYKSINLTKQCLYCKQKIIKVTTSDNKIMYNAAMEGGKGIKIMMPDEIRKHCNLLCANEKDMVCKFIPVLEHTNATPPIDILFFDVIPVPPPVIRPCNVLHGELMEHPQSQLYKNILGSSFKARSVIAVITAADKDAALNALPQLPRQAYESVTGSEPAEKLHSIWQEMQKNVNLLLSSDTAGGLGLKQIIERKSGVIRMHMMGKRVNYAARSVITPDPNVDIDEIGIPEAFAMKLTYPVPVTSWNVEELRKMVINGPNLHPGAEMLESEDGRITRIPTDCIEKRKSLAKRLLTPDDYVKTGLKIVHRHLINGDVLLLNRQPTLHKPSIMAHRARILKGEKTLRLHYANCKSYNADFDGDEMNAHYPQNEIARSEAYNIMSVRKQYLVPKDGTPLSGLIQDHVISGVKMSIRGNFFNESDYHQLVFQGLANFHGRVKLLPPAILKPQRLWSGKQVLSTVILNTIPKGKPYISLLGKAKISAKAWQTKPTRQWAHGTPFKDDNEMSEAKVIIRNGELLCGVLDKTHYGATPYGLVHCMYELYGGDSSSSILSSFSKLFTFYLQWEGFTLGVSDILVVDESNEKRDDYIRQVRASGNAAAAQASELPADTREEQIRDTVEELRNKNPKFQAALDRQYKTLLDGYTNKINTVCLSEGLLTKFPDNNLQLMVQSGAKGSTVNTMQISCLLGQIELEGKRPPLMISGRSLPSFLPYDTTPRAGGFIDGRFMTGIQPQEFFFHCMAGREGLIDTAVKTSRSGYLQRCLIKHLEGLSVGYDMTVRDSDGSVIQFAYGEDGLDVCKAQFFDKDQLAFIDENSNAFTDKDVITKLKAYADTKKIQKAQKSLRKWIKKNGDPLQKLRLSSFTEYCKIEKENVQTVEDKPETVRDLLYPSLSQSYFALDQSERRQYGRKPCPEPITSKMSPEYQFGVICESLDNLMQSYLKSRPSSEHLTGKKEFEDVIHAKVMSSMAAPGEPVGLLAAQSVGEPSTQMTLNTFHFAGRGDMNVTLGIPRLREILMTASSHLKTPNMDIPFLPDVSNRDAEKLRLKLNRVTVADVLEKIDIECGMSTKGQRQLRCKMRFTFLPHKQYKMQFSTKPRAIIKHMQNKFFGEMFVVIKKLAKVNCGLVWAKEDAAAKRKSVVNDDDDDNNVPMDNNKARTALLEDSESSDEEQGDADDDNTQVKSRSKHTEVQEYEDPESGEEEHSDEELEKEVEPEKEVEIVEPMETDKEATNEVLDNYDNATNYIYDTKDNKWCEITILFPISFLRIDLSQALRDAAAKSVIHEVKNIKRAITIKNKAGLSLKTDGINIIQMSKYDHLLDLNKLYSNDIHAIAKTYGIEAASKIIIKEIQSVFNVYGIQVDFRHLSLISDYMTYNGVFEPMSRKGMESSASPLQQMSFESSLVFLKEAVINGKIDALRSVSSCLMLGQPCKTGTGSFTVYTDMAKTAE